MARPWLLLYVTLQTCHGLAGFGAMKKASKPKKKKKRPRPMSEWRKPGNVLPRTARPVPESIMRPDYANSGTPRAVDLRPSWMIEVKSKKERVGRMVQMHANAREEIKEVRAGDIAALIGMGFVDKPSMSRQRGKSL